MYRLIETLLPKSVPKACGKELDTNDYKLLELWSNVNESDRSLPVNSQKEGGGVDEKDEMSTPNVSATTAGDSLMKLDINIENTQMTDLQT